MALLENICKCAGANEIHELDFKNLSEYLYVQKSNEKYSSLLSGYEFNDEFISEKLVDELSKLIMQEKIIFNNRDLTFYIKTSFDQTLKKETRIIINNLLTDYRKYNTELDQNKSIKLLETLCAYASMNDIQNIDLNTLSSTLKKLKDKGQYKNLLNNYDFTATFTCDRLISEIIDLIMFDKLIYIKNDASFSICLPQFDIDSITSDINPNTSIEILNLLDDYKLAVNEKQKKKN